MQMNADIAARTTATDLVTTQAENRKAEADAQAYAIEAVVKPLAGLDPRRCWRWPHAPLTRAQWWRWAFRRLRKMRPRSGS